MFYNLNIIYNLIIMSKKTQNKQQRQQKRRQNKTQKKQQKCQQKQQKQRKTQKRQQKRQQQRRSRKQQLKKKQRGGAATDDDIEKINKILGWLLEDHKIEIKKLNRDLGSGIIDSERSKKNVNGYIKAIQEKKVKGTNVDDFLLLIKNPNLAVEYFNSDYDVIDVIDSINKFLKKEQQISNDEQGDIRNSFIARKKATETTTGVRKSTDQTQSQSTPRNQPTTARTAASTVSPDQKKDRSANKDGGHPSQKPQPHVAKTATPIETGSTTSTEHPQTPRTFNVKETKTNDNLDCYSIIEVKQSS